MDEEFLKNVNVICRTVFDVTDDALAVDGFGPLLELVESLLPDGVECTEKCNCLTDTEGCRFAVIGVSRGRIYITRPTSNSRHLTLEWMGDGGEMLDIDFGRFCAKLSRRVRLTLYEKRVEDRNEQPTRGGAIPENDICQTFKMLMR